MLYETVTSKGEAIAIRCHTCGYSRTILAHETAETAYANHAGSFVHQMALTDRAPNGTPVRDLVRRNGR